MNLKRLKRKSNPAAPTTMFYGSDRLPWYSSGKDGEVGGNSITGKRVCQQSRQEKSWRIPRSAFGSPGSRDEK